MKNNFYSAVRCLAFGAAFSFPLMFCMAAPGTWTNTTAGTSAFWTNDVNWSASPYPGSAASESAFLTNNAAGAYTNILDAALPHALNTLVISNGTGQAWLVVTNTALTTTTLTTGNGGRLQIIDGGLTNTGIGQAILGFRSTISSELTATNSQLVTSGFTIGLSSSSNTVTLLAGSRWNNNNRDLFIGSVSNQPTSIIRATDNTLTIDGGGVSGGAMLSNVASLFVGGPTLVNVSGVGNTFSLSNRLIIANGGVMLTTTGAVGISTGPGGGYNHWLSNNTVTVTGSGSIWSNQTAILVGGSRQNASGAANRLEVLDQARVVTANLFIGGGGGLNNGRSNQVLVSGNGSVLTVTNTLRLGFNRGNTGNRLTIADGAEVRGSNLVVASSDIVLVTGANSVLTNTGAINLGAADASQFAGEGGMLTISNGAKVFSASGAIGIQHWNTYLPNSNSVTIVGGGSQWRMPGGLTVGGSTGAAPTNNNLTVSQGGVLVSNGGTIGGGTSLGGSNNWALITGSGSAWTNTGHLVVGSFGHFSRLTVADGGAVLASNLTIGLQAGVLGSEVVVAGAGKLVVTNGLGTGRLLVGGGSSGRLLLDQGTLTVNHLFIHSTSTLTANLSRVTISGTFTNTGTLSFINSRGTFGSVVNSSQWISDPSVLTFHGVFSNAPSATFLTDQDTYYFRSDFINQITDPTKYDTTTTKFIFDGGSGTQIFQVAGLSLGAYGAGGSGGNTNPIFFTHLDLQQYSTNAFVYFDPTIPGFTNNFALGGLSVQNASTLMLTDNMLGGSTSGLYVASLSLGAGSQLIISNNVHLYFKGTNGVTGLAFGTWADNPLANVLLLEGAGFHSLVVPEPSTLLLLLTGGAVLVYRRRRNIG